MSRAILGVDIAKTTFDVCLLTEGKRAVCRFENRAAGIGALLRWLKRHRVRVVHACMEATGRYHEALALRLHRLGHTVSVVNPACVHAHANSRLRRTKTDRADAQLLADYCRTQMPTPWQPPAPELRVLHDLTRRVAQLQTACQQERNRLHTPELAPLVRRSIRRMLAGYRRELAALKAQIAEHINGHPQLARRSALLCSIPGIGVLTAAILLAHAPLDRVHSARQLAAYAGLTPQQRLSGSSIHGKPRISKVGNAHLRGALYMPAVVAKRFNPVLKAFAARLHAKGLHNMAIVAAVMRKLLHIAFGVVKNGIPFDPAYPPRTA